MSQQLSLKSFFKLRVHPQNSMEDRKKKKLNLSHNKVTPTKALKLCSKVNSPQNVIDLTSDDENYFSEPYMELPSSSTSSNIALDTSDTTVNYTPEIKRNSSQSPSVKRSSTPKRKVYSPTKKRNVALRTPTKAKRNLSHILLSENCNDETFIQICNGLDDKTIFMLKIINEYLKEESLYHLLQQESYDLLEKMMKIVKYGIMLMYNLYGRKDRWFRWKEIKDIVCKKYQEIDDHSCHAMLSSLLENGFIVATNYEDYKNELCYEEYVAILKKDELKEICKYFKIKVVGKDDSVKALRSFIKQKYSIGAYFGTPSDNEKRVLHRLSQSSGPCFKLSELTRRTLDELYLLMYLGIDYRIIREKKLELMLIQDKANIQTFPYDGDVKTDNASLVFNTRQDFVRYLEAISMYEEYLVETDLGNKCEWVKKIYNMHRGIEHEEMERYLALPVWLQRYAPPYIYIKLLEDGIKYLKKDKKEESICLALEIISMMISQKAFRQHKKAGWYAEKALILDKFVGASEEAAAILLEGFNSDLSDEAKDMLRPRASLLANRQVKSISKEMRAVLLKHAEKEEILEKELNVKHIYKLPMENCHGGKIKFESRTAEGRIVQDAEDFCRSWYIQEGKYTHGGHWEGRIVTTIFFLLFWDVIYGEVRGARGVVLCRLQPFPLDMFGEGFYHNRRAAIQERLHYIELATIDALLDMMRNVWDTRPENEVSGINRQMGWGDVAGVSACLGPRGLAAVCRRLALDYGYAHSGFPDLTMWNDATKKIVFVEVKSDSDKPSMKQIQWMHYLKANNISTEFCYVGVNTTRCRARRADPGPEDDL